MPRNNHKAHHQPESLGCLQPKVPLFSGKSPGLLIQNSWAFQVKPQGKCFKTPGQTIQKPRAFISNGSEKSNRRKSTSSAASPSGNGCN